MSPYQRLCGFNRPEHVFKLLKLLHAATSGDWHHTQTGSLMTTETNTQLLTQEEAGERTFRKICDLMEHGHSQVLTRAQLNHIALIALFDVHKADDAGDDLPEGVYRYNCDYDKGRS